MTVFDLGTVHLITDRPGAAPAPTHTGAGDPPTRPGDGPWKPGGPSVTDRPTDDIVADLYAAIARSRRARGATTDDLPEVA